jgi:hypothetical protein
VLWDAESRNQTNYAITIWPTAIIIGIDGKIVWAGNPWRNEGSYDETARFCAMLEGELNKVITGKKSFDPRSQMFRFALPYRISEIPPASTSRLWRFLRANG